MGGHGDAFSIGYISNPALETFFAALRTVTGLATGYAQILAEPLGWAHTFDTHLPGLYGVYVRSYPNWFENYYWNAPLPSLTEQQVLEVGEIYTKMQVLQSREIGIAARRLNSCFLRESEEDSLLDATIALETLLSDDDHQEMTHKLALRVAAVLKLSKDVSYEPWEIVQTVKQIYAYRSVVVHGNTKAHKKKEVQFRTGKKMPTRELATEYLRLVLKILIERPEYLDSQKIDQDLLLGRWLSFSFGECLHVVHLCTVLA